MSFGFSVGDFVATALLIKDVIAVLRESSASEYRELMLELHRLQRALDETEHLKYDFADEATVNAVRVAALMCQHPLDEFAAKLKKFESLNKGALSKWKDRAKQYSLKLQWGFTMSDEVQKLRAYLVAHVGSLNMRLTILGLQSSSNIMTRIDEKHHVILGNSRSTKDAIDCLAQDAETQRQLVESSQMWLRKLWVIANSTIVPQLATLLDLASKIWAANLQVIDILTKQHADGRSPDTQHTWFQEPVKFEDALGRIMPIPSEYNWGKVYAIIQDQFKHGPGHMKVTHGEFELFSTRNRTQLLSASEWQGLMPGMSITMAFIIGFSKDLGLQHCPRPGCDAREFKRAAGGGKSCVWFDLSHNPLPRPFRLTPADDTFPRMRNERKTFKNVRLFPTDLPNIFPVVDMDGFWTIDGATSKLTPRRGQYMSLDPDRAGQTDLTLRVLGLAKAPIPKDLAVRAVETIAEALDIDVRDLCSVTEPGSFGLDSLSEITLAEDLRALGIKVPEFKDGWLIEGLIF